MNDQPLWYTVLVNRFSVTFGAIAVLIALWNVYVERHDDGLLSGQVVTADGLPAAAANVVLSEQTIVSLTPLMNTTTDDQGRFQFRRHNRHHVVLTASKDAVGESPRYRVRLYFRNQNRELRAPLQLVAD